MECKVTTGSYRVSLSHTKFGSCVEPFEG